MGGGLSRLVRGGRLAPKTDGTEGETTAKHTSLYCIYSLSTMQCPSDFLLAGVDSFLYV